MPDVDLARPYHKQSKPLVFFFNLQNDSIKLVIEVGPVNDKDLRNKLVTYLNGYINKSQRVARSDIYTRVWSKSERCNVEDMESEEILEVMNKLYMQINADVIRGIKTALSEVFPVESAP